MNMEEQQLWFWDMIKKVAIKHLINSDLKNDIKPINEESKLASNEIREIYKTSIQPVVSAYFTGVVRTILDTNQNGSYPLSSLDSLLDLRCGTQKFAERVGIDVKEGKALLQVAKDALLEELANKDLTLMADNKTYTLHKKDDDLYVKIH